ncbi:MAG TPA: hypothetical protein VGR09_01675 [Gemmatimonadales bacterium]|nr:hypothetical protein [Gemmatimonadales bacterium]
MVVADWLDQHTSQAPPALRARVRQYALLAAGASLPHVLATAGQTALDQVLSHPGDRSAALDLLAADALITLALLAQAETNSDRLGEFATLVLQTPRALS